MNNVSGLQIDSLVPTQACVLRVGDEFVVNGEVPVYKVVEVLTSPATGMVAFVAHCAFNKRDLTMTFYAGHVVYLVK